MDAVQCKIVLKGPELEDTFRLRYKIYCEERGFEKLEDHPDGIETDKYDSHSLHFAYYNQSGQLVGTVRIILDSEDGFPIERHCQLHSNRPALDKSRLGEISRLALSKDVRRRAEDAYIYYDGIDEQPVQIFSPAEDRRHRHEIVISLYKRIYIESKKMGLTHWYTVMSKGLHTLLGRLGIIFRPIGPEQYYHGLRTPYLGEIEEIENNVKRLNPAFYEEATAELKRSE
jgi:N-acyl amino acid synthase of PEP-CTERM/exosortase system